jgi:pimeloyl-ACP methyl ester carboxylesterase
VVGRCVGPGPASLRVHRAKARGLELAYFREGAGGLPLVLLHGWPETKRIWWRNVAPLAAAGFAVIAPDLRGFGDSAPAPDDAYDAVTHARDVEALVRGVLGHRRCVVCAGDLGGVIAQDLSLRFEGFVERLILFNTIAPILPGSPSPLTPEVRMAGDYFRRQSRDADRLAAELDTPERRQRYVAAMYGPRLWAAPGTFDPESIEFMTGPFADATSFRASIANYEYYGGPRVAAEPARMLEVNPTPTLVLYGPEDHVIPRDFCTRMEAAFPERIGPFVVPGAGHFLQWEAAGVMNRAVRYFCGDLLAGGESGAQRLAGEE